MLIKRHIGSCLPKVFAVLVFAIMTTLVSAQNNGNKYNVLFIMVDDLKPDLNCYGYTAVKSPNIDALASTATVFDKAYCQQAICGPTRASLLTGLRPDKTKVWDLKAQLRDNLPNAVSLPQYFKSAGYYTAGMGKIFDLSNVDAGGDMVSWSVPFTHSFELAKGYEDIAFGIYQTPAIKAIVKQRGDAGKDERAFWGKDVGPIRYSTECLDVPDNAYMDGAMADYAVAQLEQLKNNQQPFFLAVGFKKPHLPFVAPKKYWDLYDRSKIDLAPFQDKAANSPDVAYHNSGELRNYRQDIVSINDDKTDSRLKLAEDKQRELIHGYYACISYTDAQIGKLLAALKQTGLDKNTIVVLIGDHGWHLGDHSLWCKHSNFEQATHAPMIISVPGVTKGQHVTGIAEYVDLYPTLCELNGLQVASHLDGKSLAPALKNNKISTKDFAISQYPRGTKDDAKGMMGYTIRNERYRYTEWTKGFTSTSKVFDKKDIVSVELYDYKNDPLETKNIAHVPAMHSVANVLAEKLHGFYKQQFETSK